MSTVIEDLKEALGKEILDINQPRKDRIYLRVSADDAKKVVEYLFFDYKCKFSTASGMDIREGIEIIYHLAREDKNMVINVKSLLPYPNLSMESIAKRIPALNWIEREMHEMLGVEFKGHPDMRRLLLADSFPEGKYPLRKDFKHEDVKDEDYDYKRSGL